MKCKLIGNNDYIFELEETIFKNRGIKNIELFKNPTRENLVDFRNLDNINKAVKLLKKHIDKKNNIHIICDSDVDGVTSAAILYNRLSKLIPEEKVSWNIHQGKEHGIILDELKDFDFDLLIVPDAGSDNIDEHKKLKEDSKDIIILDHHPCQVESDYAIVVNNQMCGYRNKALSGAGIVFKFCQALDVSLELGDKYSDKYMDLVALGLIADCMNTREAENRYLISNGLKNINNDFFKALVKKQSFSIKRKNINDMAFYIAPLINAIFRVGTLEERKALFQAFIDSETTIPYKKRGSKMEVMVLLYEDMARRCVNIKNRQKREQVRFAEEIEEQIKSYNLLQHNILIVNATGIVEKNFNGLVANSLSNKYNKPTLILSEKSEGSFSGSGRSFRKCDMESLKKEIESSGLSDYVAGHDNAFGVIIKKENLKPLIRYFDGLNYDFNEKTYNVDFIMKEKDINEKVVKEFYSLIDLYGQEFDEALILVEKLNVSNVVFNEKMTMMSFDGENNIRYTKFFPTDKDVENLSDKNIEIKAVVKLNVNTWNNNIIYQAIIEDYEIIKKIEKRKDDFKW